MRELSAAPVTETRRSRE